MQGKYNKIFKRLDTPQKIQDFLDRLPFNFEKKAETYRSPVEVLRAKQAHCFEGACFALACLHFHGKEAYLLDLKTFDLVNDADHAVCIFKEGQKNKKNNKENKKDRWGAISKTNHAVLRYRDPIYPSIESLAYSYFHEYFLNDGVKTLDSYSKPFDVVKRFGASWIESSEELDNIALALDKSPHTRFYPVGFKKKIRKASKIEVKSASLEEWKRKMN